MNYYHLKRDDKRTYQEKTVHPSIKKNMERIVGSGKKSFILYCNYAHVENVDRKPFDLDRWTFCAVQKQSGGAFKVMTWQI